MNIKSQKDFFAGLMFLVVGALFAIGATRYNVGTAARMGPGYFPLLLGILLAVLGAGIIFYSMVHNRAHGKEGDKVGAWAWKPIGFVLGANIIFGMALGGLPSIGLPAFGLVVGIFLLVAIGGLADKSNQPKAMLRGFFIAMPITAVGLVIAKLFPKLQAVMGDAAFLVICVLLTVVVLYGFLSFLLPLIFTRLAGNANFKKVMLGAAALALAYGLYAVAMSTDLKAFAANLGFLAEIEFKIMLAVALIFITPKIAIRMGFSDHNAVQLSLLISVMCFISVWAFIDGLRLQIPMWPAFITG
jgi:Tripartite tricarboxylate transporter TctB family